MIQQQILRRATRYALVGASGLVIDLSVLIALVELAHWPVLVANICAFTLAVTNNYVLNRYWTYRDRRDERTLLNGATWFLSAAVIGLLMSEAVLYGGELLSVPYQLAKLFAVGVVFVWNFLFNSLVTFRAIPLPGSLGDISPSAPAPGREA